MNERIKELAREAADGMLSYDAEGEWRLSEREVGKLTELIVWECCAAISDTDRYRSDYFVATIKQHFGVEE
jgi:hypothetical protein